MLPSNFDGRIPKEDPGALALATVRQAPGSMMRFVQFRGGDLEFDGANELVLSMALTANHALSFASGRTRTDVIPLIGRFGLMTPGERFRITFRGHCIVLQLTLPRELVAEWIEEDHEVDGVRTEIGWGYGLDDPLVRRLVWAAKQAGPAEEKTFLRLLVGRLLERFSAGAIATKSASGGLPAVKLRRVIERIEDDPNRSASVDELARIATMSPFHFAHQFQRTTGRSPHRFIVERHLSRAINLLSDPKLTVADVAARSGFSHSSHLSRQLRRVIGLSPLAVRRELLL